MQEFVWYIILILHILSRSCGKCFTIGQPLMTKVHFTTSSILCITLQWGLIQSTKKSLRRFLLVVMHALIIAAAKSMPQTNQRCLTCAKSIVERFVNI